MAGTLTPFGNGIGSAAGYDNYSNLVNPLFSEDLITRYYARTIGGKICAQDILPAEIKNIGNQVIFRRTPKAKIHPYTKNQILERDGLSTVTIAMPIDRGLYFNLDIDDVDQHQIPNIDNWIEGYKYDAVERVAMHVDREIMDTIAIGAHSLNRGRCAGAVSRSYDMGAMGSPVDMGDSDIILDKMNEASAVLGEANVDFADRFIVLPVSAQPVLARSQVLASSFNSGLDRSMQLVGMDGFASPIAGFDSVYFSNLLPRRWDPVANRYTYACIFGRRDATGFVTQISRNDYIPKQSDRFAAQWRALFIYGLKVLRPEALGVLYASFNRKTEA